MDQEHRPYKRKHFFVNPRLQTHYIIYTSAILLICTGTAVASMYFGIWGSVLREFSSIRIQNDLINAARMREYEQARHPNANMEIGSLALFREVELLTEHQKQIWSDILKSTHDRLIYKYILLVVLMGWGSIFLTHKIAGPLYRFQQSCNEVKDGNLRVRIHLRKFDEATELLGTFNQMAEHLDQSLGRVKKILRDEPDPGRSKARIQEELSRFKTSE